MLKDHFQYTSTGGGYYAFCHNEITENRDVEILITDPVDPMMIDENFSGQHVYISVSLNGEPILCGVIPITQAIVLKTMVIECKDMIG
jgi:hypothetical protein